MSVDPTTPTPIPESPDSQTRPQCRSLTVEGHRCKNDALDNSHLCYSHARHRHPTLPHPSQTVVPLLEDHASVRLVATQVIHGLLSHTIETDRARAVLYALQIAAFALPRPVPQPDGPPPNPSADQVHSLALDEEGPIAADGDQPAPNTHWHLPAPDADPLALLDAAPNTPRLHPLPATDPLTHCDCPICRELLTRGAWSSLHPHLQPLNNPRCSFNHPDCGGPESEVHCPGCARIRKFTERPRRKRHPQSAASRAASISARETAPPTPAPPDEPRSDGPLDLEASATPGPCPPQPVPCNLQPGTCSLPPGVIPQAYYPATPTKSIETPIVLPPRGGSRRRPQLFRRASGMTPSSENAPRNL
jgi:hypothetical protein